MYNTYIQWRDYNAKMKIPACLEKLSVFRLIMSSKPINGTEEMLRMQSTGATVLFSYIHLVKNIF